jgi:hypothetical protein
MGLRGPDARPLSKRGPHGKFYDDDPPWPAVNRKREQRLYRIKMWANRVGLLVETVDGSNKVAIVTGLKRAEELLARELENIV